MAALDARSVHMYSVTLQRGGQISSLCHGAFTGTPKQQEIACARAGASIIDLLHVDSSTGRLTSIHSVPVFGVIRSLAAFRLTGSQKDYLVVGSDSGKIVVLEYNMQKGSFDRVHTETFGKTGCRRIVPGQYLTADPKGRALMIAGIEKQKLVYIMNRDSGARLTISSPLEGHKAHTIVFQCIGVDVGFDNPLFACLELDYEDAEQDSTGEAAAAAQQTLTYYELDLGLNHVVRKQSEPLEHFANHLVAVPGGSDGPSGLIVCCEGYVMYKKYGETYSHRVVIPHRRSDISDSSRKPIIVASAVYKTKNFTFFLVQTDLGDLFRITLEVDGEQVTEMRLRYFETVPVAIGLCIVRGGFLFVASEFGNHLLYRITGEGKLENECNSRDHADLDRRTLFSPNVEKVDLSFISEHDSLAPIIDCKVADLAGEDSVQMYALCGRGPRSSLRTLRHGLAVHEPATSQLPGNPNAIWSVKRSRLDEFDRYLVVSFVNATLVLSIGEIVEEVNDSGLYLLAPSLSVSQLGEEDILQVYPSGIRHIKADRRVSEWKPPNQRIITCAAVNGRQVAIALTGGEIVYFELDAQGNLNEFAEKREMPAEITCMSIGTVPAGRQRFRFLALGLEDNTVRFVSLDPTSSLQPVTMQALPAKPVSLCLVEMNGGDSVTSAGVGGSGSTVSSGSSLFLNIGLDNGVLLRSSVDPNAGTLSDTRTRYLGARAVRLVRIFARGTEAILALSTRSWLSYTYESRFHTSPLNYEMLEYASNFNSAQAPEGIVAISGNNLRFLTIPQLGSVFNTVVTPLRFTPRHHATLPNNKLLLIETDHRAYSELESARLRGQLAPSNNDDMQVDTDEQLPEATFGAPKAPAGRWASVLRVFDPQQNDLLQSVALDEDEGATSICTCRFHSHDGRTFVIVGATKRHNLEQPLTAEGFLYTYEADENNSLTLIHKTPVDGYPGALQEFQGRLLAGVGTALRIYDLGKKKLLRKCENKRFPNLIVWLRSMGNRIYVGDVQESFVFVKYRYSDNVLAVFADDTAPRYLTCGVLLDYDTVAGGDKFGNIFLLRLPHDINDDVDDDPAGSRLMYERNPLNSAQQKCEMLCVYHVGDTVTSLHKVTMTPGAEESLVFTTLGGTIGCVAAFKSREDIDFFQHLEMHMRQEYPPLLGRDHLAYRSYHFPCKAVVDGDLCEMYNSLDITKRRNIASQFDKTPAEVSKRLEDMRTRHAF